MNATNGVVSDTENVEVDSAVRDLSAAANHRNVENAPRQIVLNDKKKVTDAKEKIKILERSLAAL